MNVKEIKEMIKSLVNTEGVEYEKNLDKDVWYIYYDNGCKSYTKNKDGIEMWIENNNSNRKSFYIKDNAIIKKIYTFRTGEQRRYDEKDRMIYHRNSLGQYEEWKFDDNDQLIYRRYFDGTIKEYDNEGKQIYQKNRSNYEEFWSYDEEGNINHYKDSYGNERWYINGRSLSSEERYEMY